MLSLSAPQNPQGFTEAAMFSRFHGSQPSDNML
ncbi:hypothetical protein Pvag_pPag30122 (plasmid) [Pantoea vagans C9-1]|nr:hypothetical protein Pvag_pPag30122 [Pantoea vagans C9-1]